MTQCLVCSCNQTIPLDEKTTDRPVHQALCRHEVGHFLAALDQPDDLLVACTQEQPLFVALAEQKPSARATSLRFVNIRETAGWSDQGRAAMPKIKALLARQSMAPPDPVPSVSYRSGGRLLVIGPATAVQAALSFAQISLPSLQAAGLVTGFDQPVLFDRKSSIQAGTLTRLKGFLGRFTVEWTSANPIDLDLCTRCGACQTACPEGAISDALQVDLSRCCSTRDCLKACDVVGAIRFDRMGSEQKADYDLILELGGVSFFEGIDPPRGYRHVAAADLGDVYRALVESAEEVGEFEKPKFFQYEGKLCAHGRNGQVGCRACLDVCSTQAPVSIFESGRGRIEVNPHLCMGCGACSTVCPTGAIRYAYPSADRVAQELRVMMRAYQEASAAHSKKTHPALLIHGLTSELGGAEPLIESLGREARRGRLSGLPAHWMPFGVHHPASLGLEVWLAAICYGYSEVLVLCTGGEDQRYREALARQTLQAQAILEILGLPTSAIRTATAASAEALQAILGSEPAPSLVQTQAGFGLGTDKRQALDMALEHLIAHRRTDQAMLSLPAALPAGSPLGNLGLDRERCTLCMACVGACPSSALKDGADRPQLSFIERNCVQCGLCVTSCPESALTLEPRLASLADRRATQVLNESEPFCCTRCGKPFATKEGLRAMLLRLGQHPAFAGEGLRRLEMCGDCRVIDLMGSSE